MLGSSLCAEDVRGRGAGRGGSAGPLAFLNLAILAECFLAFLDLAMLSECCCDFVEEFSIIVAACPWVDDVLQVGDPKICGQR